MTGTQLKTKPLDTGVVPETTRDLEHARALLARDGAVCLKDIGPSSEDAQEMVHKFFQNTIIAAPPPVKVSDGGEKDRRLEGKTHKDALPAHTDGFAYGDFYPDYISLVCVKASPEGGESFLVDGYAVLENLAADPATAWAAAALQEIAIDQTEEGMQKSYSPIIQKTSDGRLMVRRTLDKHGNGPKPLAANNNLNKDQEMIDIWGNAIDQAAKAAPRFMLTPGDAVIIDNYRLFHAREGYCDMSRMLWRVWTWTDASRGAPDMPLHSDARYAVA